MIIRVDDFPHGRESDPTPGVGYWQMLQDFKAALDQPFLLACLFGALGHQDLDDLDAYSQSVTIGAHGQWHTHTDARERVYVQKMRLRLGPDAVFVPPYNALDQQGINTLREVGFRYVTTGPETPGGLDYTGMVSIASAFYGTAAQFMANRPKLGDWDCATLHLTWEKNDGFKSLREMGRAINGEVHHWRDFTARMNALHFPPKAKLTPVEFLDNIFAKLGKWLDTGTAAIHFLQTGILDGKHFGTILEIGTYYGLSAALLSQFGDRVVTVDLETRPIVKELLREAGVLDRVVPVVIASNEQKQALIAALKPDMVFIDGGHSRLQVQVDYESVKSCPFIVFHDYPTSGPNDGAGWLIDTVGVPGRVTRKPPFAIVENP